MKIYTKTGDKGMTSLCDGSRLSQRALYDDNHHHGCRLDGEHRGLRDRHGPARRFASRDRRGMDARNHLLAGRPDSLDLQVPTLGRAQGDTQRLKTHKGSARRK